MNGDLKEYLNAADVMRQVKQSNCGDILNQLTTHEQMKLINNIIDHAKQDKVTEKMTVNKKPEELERSIIAKVNPPKETQSETSSRKQK